MLLVSLTISCASAMGTINMGLSSDFVEWMATYGKSYASMGEFMQRLHYFRERDDQIRSAVERGLVTPGTLSHNQFSDRIEGERGYSRVTDIDSLYKLGDNLTNTNGQSLKADGYNEIVNYCGDKKLSCNPVQDQGDQCTRSGGAFATIAAIETQAMIQGLSGGSSSETKDMLKLSEQACLDCAYKSNAGCISAQTPDLCIGWAMSNKVNLDSDYPYMA